MNGPFSIPESNVPEIPTLRRYWNDANFREELEAERNAEMKRINEEITANAEAARQKRIAASDNSLSLAYYSRIIVDRIRDALKKFASDVTVSEHRFNSISTAHQVIVEFDGQPYRVVLAPIDCPVRIGSQLADEHFTGGIVA